VSSDRVQIIKGLVLLVAVGIDVYSKSRGRPSIIARLQRRALAPTAEVSPPDKTPLDQGGSDS
jgi:putative multiple sugar transport system permease protein